MRILLAHNSTYYPGSGGGDKSNRLLMEALAARGHTVRVVARIERFGDAGHKKFVADLLARGVQGEEIEPGAVRFSRNGVEALTLTRDSHWRGFFASHIEAFSPDVIVTSTDDPAQLLFDLAVKSSARVVHLVRATIAVPFGPDSSGLSAERTARLRQADAIVGVSEYVAAYCREHGGLDATHVPISLLESGEPSHVGRFENPYITMANPCAVKGIDIFLGIADRLPEISFAAVPMWGTTAADRAELARRPNIRILDPVDEIDDLLRVTRVMLVPSVWHEARSRMIVEALSRGVPVVASGLGGIREAMMGVDYVLPVKPVERYRPAVDEHMVPVAVVPPQDVSPWVEVVRLLATDRDHWNELSARSRAAALGYLAQLSVEPFEALLLGLTQKPKKGVAATPAGDDRKKLLALMLKQKQPAKPQSNPWLPVTGPAPRLICLPYAGAGSMSYRKWEVGLTVAPVLLPARETRLAEPPVTSMPDLVQHLVTALASLWGEPYAIYGHSMGAVIGFELIRQLRRRGMRLPAALLVSGARAPQFRRGWAPPPELSQDDFIAELRRLEGVPPKILDNPELLKLALPALMADARLYRTYTYTEDSPLETPIFAYGGNRDPNVTVAHVESWREQTTGQFTCRIFDGGHFFIESQREEFLAALSADLRAAGLFR